ncbi:MAG: hypothetical protein DRJ64_09980, partial [Thermoprotei archaeon]
MSVETSSFDTSNSGGTNLWHFYHPDGSDDNGQTGDSNRQWKWDNNETTSSNVGALTGYDSAGYVYTEASSSTASDDVFTMVRNSTIDASLLNVKINFYYSARFDGSETVTIRVEGFDGSSWNTEDSQVVGNGTDATWYEYGEVDLSSYTNTDFQVRISVQMPSSGTIWHCDACIDAVSITTETKATHITITPDLIDTLILTSLEPFFPDVTAQPDSSLINLESYEPEKVIGIDGQLNDPFGDGSKVLGYNFEQEPLQNDALDGYLEDTGRITGTADELTFNLQSSDNVRWGQAQQVSGLIDEKVTLCFRMKYPTSNSNDEKDWVQLGLTGNSDFSNEFLRVGMTMDKYEEVRVVASCPQFSIDYYLPQSPTTDFIHITTTFDGNDPNTDSVMRIYADGEFLVEDSSTNITSVPSNFYFFFLEFYAGVDVVGLDDVIVFNRILSDEEIIAVYTEMYVTDITIQPDSILIDIVCNDSTVRIVQVQPDSLFLTIDTQNPNVIGNATITLLDVIDTLSITSNTAVAKDIKRVIVDAIPLDLLLYDPMVSNFVCDAQLADPFNDGTALYYYPLETNFTDVINSLSFSTGGMTYPKFGSCGRNSAYFDGDSSYANRDNFYWYEDLEYGNSTTFFKTFITTYNPDYDRAFIIINASDNSVAYSFYILLSGELQIRQVNTEIYTTSGFDFSIWHTFAWTLDDTNDVAVFYIDDVEVVSGTNTKESEDISFKQAYGIPYYISDVRLFERHLSLSEIIQLGELTGVIEYTKTIPVDALFLPIVNPI